MARAIDISAALVGFAFGGALAFFVTFGEGIAVAIFAAGLAWMVGGGRGIGAPVVVRGAESARDPDEAETLQD